MNRPTLLMMLAASSIAHAAGFEIGEEGAAATGMVGAFTAKADDATAIFYNPAGIAKLRGPQVYVGGLLIFGHSEASSTPAFQIPGGNQDSRVATVFIPNAYLAWGLPHDVALGIGVFTNFGLELTWPEQWAGRFVSTYAKLEDVTFNPCIAWQPTPWFSIGAGFDVTPARVRLRRSENLIDAEARLQFEGNAVGLGGNVGVLFQVPRKKGPSPFSLGLSYRSQYDFEFSDGALRIENVPRELSGVLHDTRASAVVAIPDLVSVGIGGRPFDNLFLQAQFDWSGWSRLRSIQLKAADPTLNTTIPESWKDGYTLRIGAEFAFHSASARLGFGVDWTPAPQSTLSPILPDATRYLVSAGGGAFLRKGFAIEAAVMGVIFRDRISDLPPLPVKYQTWAVLMTVGVSYRSPKAEKAHPSLARPR